jgi:LysM repeat protein
MSGDAISPGQRLIVPGNSKTPPGSVAAKSGVSASSGGTHVVRAGDTLFSIARAYATSVQELRESNGFTSSATLAKGQVLRLPPKVASNTASRIADAPAAPTARPGTVKTASAAPQAPALPAQATPGSASVIIRQGDTLYSLAKRNNTSVDALLRANDMKSGDPLRIGQSLRLP